ncbi:hypothetical protein BO99DRAFT_440488 [Aspergillus violaceofuscus CBS 115571]|uniref:RING-type domain-containing protein n=1 Tax=Aspergillus violaceofuscus (strain CBS 115571) TaxID=1450538 RepID=A0A2V5HG02_ASPV1|nr:hypothetical protein BO99DRAFT_440488 [Aspergillus violaceofuscus CBS 115571]
MAEHDPPSPSGEIVGVIIGAVALFIVISFLPIAITWHRRRRRAATTAAAGGTSSTAPTSDPHRRDSALQALTGNPSMQQLPISVERWLEEQTHSGTNETWHYAQECCAICLERLRVEVDQDEKVPTTITTNNNNLPPTQPKPAWIPQRYYHSSSGALAPTNADSDLERGVGLGAWRRGSVPLSLSSSCGSTDLDAEHPPKTEKPQQDEVVVLNRCNHVFHAACLVLWVEQHRYRCPICQASLKQNAQ